MVPGRMKTTDTITAELVKTLAELAKTQFHPLNMLKRMPQTVLGQDAQRWAFTGVNTGSHWACDHPKKLLNVALVAPSTVPSVSRQPISPLMRPPLCGVALSLEALTFLKMFTLSVPSQGREMLKGPSGLGLPGTW